MGDRVPVLWDVVEEHLDEGAYLWACWERALASPVLQPAQIAARIEERLLANLDGLAVAEAIDRLLAPALAIGEGALVATAAAALLAVPEGLVPIRQALPCGGADRRSAIVRALSLSRGRGLERELLAWLEEKDPILVAAALEALAFRRVDPGPALPPFLDSQDPSLQAAALRAARVSGQPVRRQVETAYLSPLPSVRQAAVETGLLLGFRGAYLACRRLVESGESDGGWALAALAMSGDPGDLPGIEGALKTPALRSAALVMLGYAGWSTSMERILECAADPEVARLAGEAFSAITGAAVEGGLRVEPAEEEILRPLEEDLDANLDPGPEGELPVPDPEALERWWRREGKRFDPGERYLGGRSFAPGALLEAFLAGSMRRRRWLGLELAVRSRRGFWIETSDWASEQLQQQRQQFLICPESRLPFARLLEA